MEPHKPKEKCKNVFAMLSEYLDAELDASTCQDIEQHLAACPPCIEFLHSLKRSIALCHEHRSPEAPPPLSAAERDQLRAAYQKALGTKR
ncbi:MAG: zf-HC2 domain-containing protein [Bryobacteraceae bacterium]